ncbi:MAG: hypothetical protein U0528_08450 [Anaerolineae bacterium]
MQTGRNPQTFQQRFNAPEPTPAWKLGTAAFFVVAYVLVWIASLTLIVTLRGEIDGNVSTDSYLLTVFLAHLVLLIGIVQWARQRLGADWTRHLHLEAVRGGQFIFALLIGLGVAWALDLVGGLLGVKAWLAIPPLYNGLIEPVSLPWILGAVAALILQPIVETIIFTGLLYPVATQRAPNNSGAVLATAFAFMFVNVFLSVQQGSWFVVAQPLLMAAFISGVRAYTQSTRLAIAARIGFGLLIVLVAIIQ